MRVRDDRRSNGLLNRSRDIVSKESTNWGNTHGSTVAERTSSSKQALRAFRPVLSGFNLPQETVHGWTIAAIAVITFGEAARQCWLMNMSSLTQHGHNRHGHQSVVRVRPRSRCQSTLLD
jgi:hypothetical protein